MAMVLAAAQTVMAGGLLTNTNQNVSFLRNPARDAAIGIDGVYSNPAGVAFLGEGFHLSLNIQNAHQTRTVSSWSNLYKLGMSNNGRETAWFYNWFMLLVRYVAPISIFLIFLSGLGILS